MKHKRSFISIALAALMLASLCTSAAAQNFYKRLSRD